MAELLKTMPYSLRISSHAPQVCRILEAAMAAVDPQAAVRRALRRDGSRLHVAGRTYELSAIGRILLVGAGKASVAMARGLVQALGEEIDAGVIVAKNLDENDEIGSGKIQALVGSHPVPDQRSLDSTRQVTDLLRGLQADDLVFCLISGGGSALLTQPAPGVSLEDLQQLTRDLLACGATIQEINTLRKHLDQVKGGGLLRLAQPASLVTLILSDVVGSPLETIASGPSVADPSTFAEAVAILKSYQIWESTPPNIREHLEKGVAGAVEETLKPGVPRLERGATLLVGSNQLAAEAAVAQAQQEGFDSLLLTTYLQGEAAQAGKFLAAIARQSDASGSPLPRPACLLVGGETTVTLRGDGKGGRNQEVALGAVESLAGLPGAMLVTLATDGEDATSGAAGAVVTGKTARRAKAAGLDPADYLRRNDSTRFFEALGDLILTGPTGTNVNDLNFLFLFAEEDEADSPRA